jgi:hypothetical protein
MKDGDGKMRIMSTFAKKKKSKGKSCCCDFQLEEIPEKNETQPENSSAESNCCEKNGEPEK